MLKARRQDNPSRYVLVEELVQACASSDSVGLGFKTRTKTQRRLLADDDNIYHVQHAWKSNAGKLVLTERTKALQEVRKEKTNRRPGLQRWHFMKFSSLSREQKEREKTEAIVDGT